MEIPGFQQLAECGIPQEVLEGQRVAAKSSNVESSTMETWGEPEGKYW